METEYRLEKITLRNYRACRNTTFSPNEQLSALIGVNGSGKTTVLSAIFLLKKIFTHSPAFRQIKDSNAETSSIEAIFSNKNVKLIYRSKIIYSVNDRNVDEILSIDDKWLISKQDSRDKKLIPIFIPTRYLREIINSRKHRNTQNSSTIEEFMRKRFYYTFSNNKERETAFKYISEIEKVVSLVTNINYYSASQFTDPRKCPSSFELEDERAIIRDPTGAGHVKFLQDLYNSFSNQASNRSYNRFISIVSKDTLGLVDKISFKAHRFPTSQLEVKSGGKLVKRSSNREIIIPYFSVGGLKLSPNQLSEGTLKMIVLMFYILTDQSRLLLVEEPEVCVHHGLITSIVELMKRISSEKQIVFSTHSDYVLDMLSPPDVFLTTLQRKRGIKIENLSKSLPSKAFNGLKEYLATTGNLGEYIRQGGISHA